MSKCRSSCRAMRFKVGVHRPRHVWGPKGYEYAVRFHVGLRYRTGQAAPETILGWGSPLPQDAEVWCNSGGRKLDRSMPREKQGRQNNVVMADESLAECTKT